VRRFLAALPKHFHQIAMSIETLLELGDVPVEELVGRLKAAEERYGLTGGGAGIAQLNLTEDELVARVTKRLVLNSDKGSGSSSGSPGGQPRGHGGGRGERGAPRQKGGEGGSREKRSDVGARGNGGARGGGRDVARDECRYCGTRGHWAKECPKRRRDTAHLAQVDEDQEAHTLLVATAEEVTASIPICPTPSAFSPLRLVAAPVIHLDEGNLFVQLGERGDGATTQWILDSGATNHMTGPRSAFAELDSGVRGSVRFGDSSTVGIEGRGMVLFMCKTGEHQKLAGVYHIPRLAANIISLGQLEQEGFKILLEKGALKIWDTDRRLVAAVPRAASRLYILEVSVDKPVCFAAHTEEAAWRWHACYGHLGFQGLQKLSKGEMVRGLPKIKQVAKVCDGCLIGKQRRHPFSAASKFRAERPLQLVHADLCGPITPPTPRGKKLFLLAVDDMSRYMWALLLASKDEAASALTHLQVRAEVEVGHKLGTLRTDRGGEFTAQAFMEYCASKGVQHHLTAPYTPQQNGVVERRNQTVLGMARCMLKSMGVPGRFWGEAVTTAVFVLNRAPTRALEDKTPYEAWYGHKPAVHFLSYLRMCHTRQGGRRPSAKARRQEYTDGPHRVRTRHEGLPALQPGDRSCARLKGCHLRGRSCLELGGERHRQQRGR
jgi:transposase InsO family protein